MAEYIDRDALVRQIICNMAEYVGAPDDVLKHDEQCNYAISCVENAPAVNVEPKREPAVWVRYSTTMMECSRCGRHTARHRFEYCPHCGAPMCERKEE